MSLDVPAALLDRAERGEIDDAEFIACVRDSLPYAWRVISAVVADLDGGKAVFADNSTPPPSETDRGQLLRALASDAVRGGLERHFGVKLAFTRCLSVSLNSSPGHTPDLDTVADHELVAPMGNLDRRQDGVIAAGKVMTMTITAEHGRRTGRLRLAAIVRRIEDPLPVRM
jgi:hypothetical protein